MRKKTTTLLSLILSLWIFSGCEKVQVAKVPQERITDEQKIEEAKSRNRDEAPSSRAYYYYLLSQLGANGTEEDLQGIMKALREVIKEDPNNGALYHELASYHAQFMETDKAVPLLEKSLKVDPGFNNSRLLLAEIYKSSNEDEDVRKAVALYNDALLYDPENEYIYILLSFAHQKLGEERRGIDILESAIDKGVQSALLYYYLGDAYTRFNDISSAERYYRLSAEIKDDFVESWKKLGATYLRNKKYEEAEKVYQHLNDIEPETPLYLQTLAEIQLELGKREEAEKSYRLLLKEDPDNQSFKVKITTILMDSNRLKEAEPLLKELIADEPENVYYQFYLAILNAKKKKYKVATSLLEKILEKAPKMTRIRLFLASTLEEQGKLKKALKVYEEALSLEPDNAEIYYYRGRLHREEKDFEKARADYEKAVAINPTDHRFHFNLGALYEELKEKKKAMVEMKAALKHKPDFPSALNYLAYLYSEEGIKLDEAEKMIKKALEKEPKNGYFIDTLAWIYYKQKRYKLALKSMLKAIKTAKDDPIIFDHLGDIYKELGKKREAATAYKKSIQLEPDAKKKKTVQEKLNAILKQ